ncbi:MAG TPA: NAD(+)/NADH kinase [Thermoplasmata archaeon]|nr:NAD(+)/NADH kinase [Thermoplasmata archaeon]
MRIGLTAHPEKPHALALAERVVELVGDRAELVLSDEIPAVAPRRPHAPLSRLGADVVVAIGGDGTFLHALRRTEVPLLPINAGTVGVLAEVEARRPKEIDFAVERLLRGLYFLEERMKLAAQIGTKMLPDATNEFVVHSAAVAKMGWFELAFDGHVAGRLRADGLIVASPTGSTGYALSSRGPIVDSAVDAILLIAIAPFRTDPRAVVLEPLRSVRLRPVEEGPGAIVVADGDDEFPVTPTQPVTIYRSPRRAVLVRFGSQFFHRLQGKRILPWSEEFAEEGPALADLPPPP